MNSSIFRFTLDLHRTQSQISIPVMRGDTGRTFRINLSDGGNPYIIEDGCLAKLSIKRPTRSRLEEFCTVEDNTTIVYSFEQNINTAISEGIHECDITLYGLDGKILGTAMFTMVVSERVVRSNDIVLTDEDFTAVDAMLKQEAARQLAEAERREAEDTRKVAEEERKEAEAKRNEAEEKRAKALDEKVDKATPNADYTVLYALKSNGEHTTQRLTPHAVGNTVMFRDANGYCKVGEPAKDEHIANKRYVDKANQAMQADIDTLEALADKLNKQLNPPVNVWKIRGDADISYVAITENIRFYANDVEFDTIQIGDPYSYGDPHLWYDYQGRRYTYLWGMSESHPNSDAYSTIKIPYDEKLSAEFTSWLEANAEYLGEEEYVRPEPSEMITFSVCNYMHGTTHELTCPEGMTWGDYFNSGYCDSSKIMLSGFDPDGMIVKISDESLTDWYSYIFYGINSETVIEDGGDYSGDEYFG